MKGKKISYTVSQKVGDRIFTISHCLRNEEYSRLRSSSVVENFHFSRMFAHLFPKGYPTSVAPGYRKYAIGQALATCFSAASGVLSTNALLVGLGVGASSAAPLAGTLNWIIKDGIGQIGGILFASLVSEKFDENPRRWRLLSSIAMDSAALLELCTPLFPTLFLPIAAVANIGKNISFLASSASRASLNKSFATHGNLADVTAKCGSQTIMASMLGTGAGIVLAGNIPGKYRILTETPEVSTSSADCVGTAYFDFASFPVVVDSHAVMTMVAFLALSGASLTINYLSLQYVPVNALTRVKLDHVFRNYWDNYVAAAEEITVNHSLSAETSPVDLLTPLQLSPLDLRLSSGGLYDAVHYTVGGSLIESVKSMGDIKILLSEFENSEYILAVYKTGVSVDKVSLLFRDSATRQDVIRGLVHLHVVRRLLDASSWSSPGDCTGTNIRQGTRVQLTNRQGIVERCKTFWRKRNHNWIDSPCSELSLSEIRKAKEILYEPSKATGGRLMNDFLQALEVSMALHRDPTMSWMVDSFVLEQSQSRLQIT